MKDSDSSLIGEASFSTQWRRVTLRLRYGIVSESGDRPPPPPFKKNGKSIIPTLNNKDALMK